MVNDDDEHPEDRAPSIYSPLERWATRLFDMRVSKIYCPSYLAAANV
jgi:hypothetical protein